MKVLSVVLAVFAVTACGTQKEEASHVNGRPGFEPNFVEANNFGCAVEQGLSAHYSSTSKMGLPMFGVADANDEFSFDRISVVGDQIEHVAQDDGTTHVSARQTIPDYGRTTWTLAVPQVLLSLDEASRSFETTLTIVFEPTSILGPLPGQETVTRVLKAQCEASAAIF